jgi:hypothetical protein
MEDVAGADIERFRPVLKKGMFQELRKAGGLASHGVGIGSYAYLRRIFESLIDQHRTEVEETCGPIAGFDKMRMGEKIGALADVLPQALVRNKAAYAILSKGIHELSEDECLRYFPMLKAAIVLILDQDLREKQRRDAEALLEAEITRIASELGNETTSAEAGDTG